MKKKIWVVSGIVGIVLLGAMGAGAFADQTSSVNQDNKLNKNRISVDEAKAIALKEVKGTVESVELEKEHGRLVYDVDVNSDDGNKVEIDVDAQSGKVVKVEDDWNDDDQKSVSNSSKQSKDIISKEEAIAIATKHTPGKVVKVEFDRDDAEYEIKVRVGRLEVKYEIDAYKGSILEKETEDDDDNGNDD
jgi:uncharacterized membrane protein YkoI